MGRGRRTATAVAVASGEEALSLGRRTAVATVRGRRRAAPVRGEEEDSGSGGWEEEEGGTRESIPLKPRKAAPDSF